MASEAVEVARRHLESMWNEPGSEFKYFDVAKIPLSTEKPSTSNKTAKRGEMRPEEWAENQGIRDVLSMWPVAPEKPKVDDRNETPANVLTFSEKSVQWLEAFNASNTSSSSTSSVVQDAAARKRDLAESSALYKANKNDVLEQLRERSVPFGSFVRMPVLKKSTASKRKIDNVTRDCLCAVSPDHLPSALGRKDQFTKRLHLPDPRPVNIEVGKNVTDHDLAEKMRRAQAYARRDDRPYIVWDCVQAFRNASSR
tara:strand:+ start:184 stop:948 length:765 start_codon:yes stop_codon:yes gene_type:complete